ncbi:hypothetical protein Tco_1214133 [Tanacetum coccineum]
MQNPGDISNPTTAFNMALALMAKAFTLNDTTPTNNNQRSSSNPSSMQIAQLGMNMDQDRQMLMVEDNVGNQNVGNQNGLSAVSEIENQHGDGNVVTAPAEGNGNGINDADCSKGKKQGFNSLLRNLNLKQLLCACMETKRANANCTLENNLQQASSSGTQFDKALVYDSDGSAELFDKVSDQKDTNKGTSANTKFAKQSILGKPPSSSRPKLYAVTHLPNSTAFPKVGETNALSKPVTSNSVPSSRESTVVNNERVIAPGIFRINPFKATRNDVNSKTNGFSPKDSRSTTRTRRPKPWNNPKSDKAKPTEKHLKEIKRIFRYLRRTVNMGLWYTKDSGFELTGFSDADYAGCKDTFKSTSGGA